MSKNLDVHFSSDSNEWQTPPWLFNLMDKEFGGFQLDAAATEKNALCSKYYTQEIDGLKQEWGKDADLVWINPPYSRIGPKFLRYGYEQSLKYPHLTAVFLVPARPDTAVWHECCAHGEVRLIRGRLSFAKPVAPDTEPALPKNAPAPFPSALVIFGARAKAGQTFYVDYRKWAKSNSGLTSES